MPALFLILFRNANIGSFFASVCSVFSDRFFRSINFPETIQPSKNHRRKPIAVQIPKSKRFPMFQPKLL